ncbi:hypothetical protein CFSAN001627_18938, partial [Clostridium botulinum CFSAN001627]
VYFAYFNYWRCNVKLKVCEEKHKKIEEKINVHDIRLNDRSKRIDKIE